ncbi:MAG: coenzyme F420-0:L-glutamate ligase / coenzyme F420:gamma-L-glutamate ligase [Archaeoglobi archaeon]|nr:coenzyme F420-0:L-glutamate ligase / coenzyme F420:gamma-L-glutamate ligase [Archaeoglobi archaeon]
MIQVIPVRGLPILKKGDDLVEMIDDVVRDGDVIAVSSKAISKIEGRIISLKEIRPSERAVRIAERLEEDPRFVELVIRESDEILLEFPFLLTRRGNWICVNSAIDRSNVPDGFAILPPENPDESARRIREEFERRGKRVAVVVTDTSGRCFRRGHTGVCIGASGLKVLVEGGEDLYGKPLRITRRAIGDQIADFATLVMGEGSEGVPVVIFRGLGFLSDDESAEALLRTDDEDVIRRILRHFRTKDFNSFI